MKSFFLLLLATFLIHISFGQKRNYSFNSSAQFDNFVEFINHKKTDGRKYFDKIYTEILGNIDLHKEYQLIPDTAIILSNQVLVTYNIQQLAILARVSKFIVLYSIEGDFKDALFIRPLFEDWSDGATHYFYEDYELSSEYITISRTRRNHLISPFENVPRGEEIIQSFETYKIDQKFIEDPSKRVKKKTGIMYPSESLSHLKSLGKNQLRLVRNYFFAKHDYDFTDPKLEEFYLDHLMYYKPTYEDVADKLTTNEKIVIEYIKQLESTK